MFVKIFFYRVSNSFFYFHQDTFFVSLVNVKSVNQILLDIKTV